MLGLAAHRTFPTILRAPFLSPIPRAPGYVFSIAALGWEWTLPQTLCAYLRVQRSIRSLFPIVWV